MMPITVKVTLQQREYLDKVIASGQCASYGHSFRFLLHFYKTNKRVIEKLKSDRARLLERLELFENGALQGKKAV